MAQNEKVMYKKPAMSMLKYHKFRSLGKFLYKIRCKRGDKLELKYLRWRRSTRKRNRRRRRKRGWNYNNKSRHVWLTDIATKI